MTNVPSITLRVLIEGSATFYAYRGQIGTLGLTVSLAGTLCMLKWESACASISFSLISIDTFAGTCRKGRFNIDIKQGTSNRGFIDIWLNTCSRDPETIAYIRYVPSICLHVSRINIWVVFCLFKFWNLLRLILGVWLHCPIRVSLCPITVAGLGVISGYNILHSGWIGAQW